MINAVVIYIEGFTDTCTTGASLTYFNSAVVAAAAAANLSLVYASTDSGTADETGNRGKVALSGQGQPHHRLYPPTHRHQLRRDLYILQQRRVLHSNVSDDADGRQNHCGNPAYRQHHRQSILPIAVRI